MDVKKKIQILRACSRKKGERCSSCPAFGQGSRNCMKNTMKDAADALEELQAELEKVKVERDAAIKDLNEFLAMDELCPIQCEWCKWNGTYCDGKTPEWRGIKKED